MVYKLSKLNRNRHNVDIEAKLMYLSGLYQNVGTLKSSLISAFRGFISLI